MTTMPTRNKRKAKKKARQRERRKGQSAKGSTHDSLISVRKNTAQIDRQVSKMPKILLVTVFASRGDYANCISHVQSR